MPVPIARPIPFPLNAFSDAIQAAARDVADSLGAPVFVENNIRSMALAEQWFGQGRNVRDFICLGVRSGIAAGLVLNGELVRGSDNLAGEIGA